MKKKKKTMNDIRAQLDEAERAWPEWLSKKRDRWADLRALVRGLVTTIRALDPKLAKERRRPEEKRKIIASAFTLKRYNDKPKPCPEKRCRGMVRPTWNCNVGKCDTCGERYAWGGMARG